MATNNAINTSPASPAGVTIGGTGLATTTAYAVLCGGTTATGAFQPIAGVGSAGQVLTSNGAGALPTFQAAAGGGVTSATGTANQITVSAATGAVTWSLPSAITAPGSLTTTTTLAGGTTVTAGTNLVSTAGNLLLPTTSSTVGQIQINAAAVFHTFGTSNTFVGNTCGNFTLTTASENTGMGANSLASLTTGDLNSGFGRYSLNACTSGTLNTACGDESLAGLTQGARNTAIGYNSGGNLATTDSNNICIGSETLGVAGTSNRLQIGSGAGTGNGQLNKAFIHGIRGITTANADAIAVLVDSAGQLGTVSSSIRYKENIEDMEDQSSPLLELRPVTFNYISHPGKKQFGLIAEEVLDSFPELVVYNEDGDVESVKYHDLPVLLLNEMQKLIKRIDDLERTM